MLLKRATIEHAVATGTLGITPFAATQLKDASYTLTLGKTLRRLEATEAQTIHQKPVMTEFAIPPEGYLLLPGEFILGLTAETLSLRGNYGCFLSARGSCAQIGLHLLLSSTFAEPDTDGPQLLEISNVSKNPILLQTGMNIVKAIFCTLE